jgi:hypothetical protein
MWTGSVLVIIHLSFFLGYCDIVQYPIATAELEKYCTTPAQAIMHLPR